MFFNGNLESSHVNGWADVWRNGRIDLNGNDTLATLAYSSLYYIMSSLPLGPTPDFVGLSPGDLAHGEGHQVLSCCYTNINFIYMFNIKNNRECTKLIMIFNVFNISSKFNFNFLFYKSTRTCWQLLFCCVLFKYQVHDFNQEKC